MKLYAFVEDEKTKRCSVGIGTDADYYVSLGMKIQDVEQAWNGDYYLAGYAPEKPEEIRKKEEIDTLKNYLSDTDWVVVKISEKSLKKDEKGSDDDLKKYADILAERAAARERINELEGDVK